MKIMKKIFSFVALLFMVTMTFGQNFNSQLPYSSFENWESDGLPTYWHSYSDIECYLGEAYCEAAQLGGAFDNHHKKIAGKHGYACQLYTVTKYERIVNGALTTGKSRIASLTYTDTANIVYTQRNGNCHHVFTCRPDSIALWARFSFLQNEHPDASIRIHIHGDVDYVDKPNTTVTTPQVGKIANVIANLTNPATTPVNGVYKSGWTRYAYKFTYWDANNNIIETPTLQNTAQPYYMLASLSTNPILGFGDGDSVAFDEIYCIYDKGLASLKIDGVENDILRNLFNQYEYSTHGVNSSGVFNNSGSIQLNDTSRHCYTSTSMPQVTIIPRSSLILSATVTQASALDPKCTITITHNDNSYYTYIINFTNLKPKPNLTLEYSNGQNTACEEAPLTVTAVGSSSFGPLQYTWSDGTTGNTYQPTVPGIYNNTVTVTDANGCSTSATANVEIYPTPVVTINGESDGGSTICAGKTATLTAAGAATYLWSNNSTATSIVVNHEGTYSVTGTSSYNCVSTATHVLTKHNNPNVHISGPSSLCSGNTANLTAVGADTYIWNNGYDQAQMTINEGGTYSVTGTNSDGCYSVASKEVLSFQSPAVKITGPTSVCDGSTITLTATDTLTNSTTYQWSNGSTGNSITVDAAGTYTVTASLDFCTKTISHQVTLSPTPDEPTVTPGSHCGSGSVTLTANTAQGNICKWYASETTQEVAGTGTSFTINNLQATTTYYVCAQNSAGCTSSRVPVEAAIYNVPNPPTVSDITYCGAGDYSLSATSPNNVQWYSDNAGTNPIESTQYITQTTTYYAAAVDDHQCRSNLVSMTVNINNIPGQPTITPISPTCSNTSVSTTLSATPGANGNQIKWYDSNFNFLGFGQRTVSVNATTTFYAATYNNSTQCESVREPVEVVVNPIPAAPQISCAPRCGAGDVTLSVNGSANDLTIQWFTANNQYLASGNSYTTTLSNTTNFKAKAINEATGCVSPSVTVTAVVNPTYQTSFSESVCGSYTWNNETFDHSGNFTRTFSTISGCDSVVTLHLTVNAMKTTVFDTTVCGQFVWQNQTYTTSQVIVKTLTSSANCDSVVTCHLTVLAPTSSTQSLQLCSNQLPYYYEGIPITSSGTKVIILTNAVGCDSIVTLNVTVSPSPTTPGITYNDTARCGSGNLTLNVPTGTNGTTCLWYNTPTGGNPVFTGTSYSNNFTESTTFYISSYNANSGCQSSRIPLHVTVNPVPALPVIENASRCGAGQITLNASIDENSTFCFWYPNNTASTPIFAGLTYTPVISSTTYYYVEAYNENTNCKSARKSVMATVNPVPATPQVTSTTNCGPLTSDFSTYITANSSSLYRWYNSNNYFLAENAHFNATVNESTSILVSNYNAQTTCESEKASINITINPNYEPQSIFDTVCQYTHYQEYDLNEFLNTVGEHQFVINETSSLSCDSLVTLYVYVKPVLTDTFSIEACGSYAWNDITYGNSGVYTQTFTAVNGCDSIVVLNLTLYPTYQINLTRMICENGSYNFNGQTLTEPGIYTANLVSVNGCDSTVTLQLNIGSTYLDTITAHVCVGDSYHQYGFDVDNATESLYISHDTIALNNCDSTTVLHLIVHEFDTTFIDATRCLGSIYNEYGFQVLADSVGEFEHIRVIPTNYCDSTVILHLTVNPTNLVNFSSEVCQGEPYSANGFDTTFTEAGVYTLTHHDSNIYDCDSITTVTITVHPTYNLILNESICDNQVYSFNNQELTTSGTYIDTLTTIHGCDSIVTLHLTVNPTFSHDTTVNICENDLPFLWNNNSQYSFWESDDYDITFQTVNGCDSVFHLHLNVYPTFVQDTNVSVCQGALPYHFDDDYSFSQAGNYPIYLVTVNGCDSIWNLHLSVIPNTEHEASQSICDNELPYTFMGETFTEAGNYDITETDDDNCITITHFTLSVKETYHHFDTVTVCQETLPYMYGDSALYEPGTYNVHFTSTLSCDSLITVLFNVIPTAQGTETLNVCSSDFPFTYGGQTFSEEGTYNVTFNREGLCDSIVTLTLIEAPEFLVVDTVVVCDHELPYSWRNNEYTVSGTYYDSLVTIHGCDSVFALSLTINPTQFIEDNTIVLCQGDSELWRGMVLTEAGIYLDTVPSNTGCREIHQVEVVVNPTYLFHDSVTVCSDDLPYSWRGMTITEAGIREDFHQTVGTYCDSIYRLTLFVNPSYHATESASACDYDLPYLWHGQELTVSGTYYDTLTTSAGCDSTFELAFTINTSLHEILADTVCQNALPYSWRGHQINDAGSYADTIPNAAGCLDIYELHLNVLPADVTTLYDTVCAGTLYQLYGFDTLALLPGTLYDQMSLTNANGCDSTVNLVLTVMPTYLYETFGETCENTPYTWRGGEFITEGTYYDSLVSSYGCDSVFVLYLTVNPTYDIFVSDSAMREHEYTYGNFVVTPADSGTFQYDIQYYTLAGCDSVIHLTLYVAFNEGVEDFTMTPEFSFFPNPTNALLNIRGERMDRIEVYALNGRLVFRGTPDSPESTALDVTQFAAGHYTVRVTLDDGKTVTGKIIISRR